MEIKYMQAGDYQIPAIELNDVPSKPLGKYALMRLRHLQENAKIQYTTLLMSGTLNRHLEETDETARRQVNRFIERTLEMEPAPDKTNDPMAWVGYMENLKARAEEIVTRELIFA